MTNEFVEFVKDQMAPLGPIVSRRMFSGAGLYYDGAEGVKRFSETVSDITLNFKTYSHNGQ